MVRAAALLTATQHACHAEPFAEAVAPFLSQHCVACHNSETYEGGFRLDTLKADLGSIHTAERWAEVMGRISAGEMPPEEQPRPTVDEIAGVVNWLGSAIKQGERAWMAARTWPFTG